QYQPVFGAGGEHAVGLTGTHGDQVVDQHPDVGLVAARAPAVQTLRAAGSVQPGEQPLGGSFLVTGGAVDLAGEEQPADHLGFQRVLQVLGIEIVIFDGVARAQDMAFSMPRIDRTICSCTSKGRDVEIPLGYSSWVVRPSGSMNTWC